VTAVLTMHRQRGSEDGGGMAVDRSGNIAITATVP
jgi:hypothetical protein